MIIEWLSKGGIVLYILVVISFVMIAVMMERFVFYRNASYKINVFVNAFYENLDIYQLEAAEDLCHENKTPIANIALKGLKSCNKNRNELKEVLENAGAHEVPKIESNLGLLSTIAYISPLLGLLGTVLGLIRAFQDFYQSTLKQELPGPGVFVNGIWESMLTTVGGLSVGIIAYVFHQYFFVKKERFIAQLEEASDELLEIFCEKSNLQN
jgi:biopolymer transport protein ExbB